MRESVPNLRGRRHVALTGANGFVGSLIRRGLPPELDVTALGRNPGRSGVTWDLGHRDPSLAPVLAARGVTDLIHAAWDMTSSSRLEAERISVQGSLDLIEAARAAGVSRIIFISTLSAFPDARSVYGQTKYRVEQEVLAGGGVVLRLGLVEASTPGGMLGAIRRQVRTAKIIPLIGPGRGVQYILTASRLRQAVLRALEGALDLVGEAIPLGGPDPIMFRVLVEAIAAAEERSVILVPVPWRLLYGGLRLGEALGLKLPVRSDSVISFVRQNPAPDFSIPARLGL